MNYVGRKEGFRQAGNFRQTRTGTHILRMSKQPKMFFDKSSNLPESVCSKPCGVGQRVIFFLFKIIYFFRKDKQRLVVGYVKHV